MSTIYAIDPGTTQSAMVVLQERMAVGGMWTNEMLAINLRESDGLTSHAVLVIEQIESMGMAVGKETFETVFWSGRFAEAWEGRGRAVARVTRRQVKLHLCGSMKAKDANIRQALIDRYGGPACVKKGGPLAGIKSHLWAALAVAVTYQDQQSLSVDVERTRQETNDAR